MFLRSTTPGRLLCLDVGDWSILLLGLALMGVLFALI